MSLVNFSGLASGIDSNSLIQATSDARRATTVVPNQKKISELEDTNSALSTLKTKLSELQAIVRGFATLNGGGVVKQAKSSDETIATAAAGTSATNGTYSITVSALAKNASYSFRSTAGAYTDPSNAIGATINDGLPASPDRNVAITIGTGATATTVNLEVLSTTTLTDFANAFNTAAGSKAVASVVNVGTTASADYRIMIVANKQGTAEGQLAVTVGTGITAANAFNNNTLSAATDAAFTISGIGSTVTRSSNSVSDIIPGVTFNFQATGTTTVSVSDDAASSASKVQEYVDKFNEIQAFIKENNLVAKPDSKPDSLNVFGPLANTRVDDGSVDSIKSAMSNSAYTSGTYVKIFADLGVTTQRDGTLALDQNAFKESISKEPQSVRTILQTFGDSAGLTGGVIDQYIRFSGLFDVTIQGNQTQIDDLNKRISEAEDNISKEEEILKMRFATLESTVSRLQSQQSALTSALAGLSR